MTPRRALPSTTPGTNLDALLRDTIIASLASVFPDLEECDRIAYALRIKVDVASALRRADS